MSGPAWALGHDVAELRALAGPFKQRYEKFVYGAFGLLKERDVALALQADAFLRLPDGGLAVARQLRVAGTHRDYTGRAVKIPAGDWMVSDFCPAGDVQASLLVLEAALRERAAAPIWLEAFMEDRQLAVALADSGFRCVAAKVAAGSEIKGLHLRCRSDAEREARAQAALPPEEYFTLKAVEWAFLDAAELTEVEGELWDWEVRQKADAGAWAQHYSSYNKRGSWTAFCLKGYSTDPLFVMKPAEMSKAWKAEHPEALTAACDWTEASPGFQRTLELLERIPGEKQRVRFMRLAPGGGELTRHADITDRDAGVGDGRVARLHLPIRSHPAVRFSAWDASGLRIDANMRPGDLWYLDQRKPHTVKNESPVERVHLVVDVLSSPALRALLAKLP